QMQNPEFVSRDVEHGKPDKGVESPPCGGGLDGWALLGRNGCAVVLAPLADAVLSGGIDAETDRPHHEPGPEACRFCELERRGEKLGSFEEAQSTFSMDLPFLAVEHRLGGYLRLVQCIRREDHTPLLVAACASSACTFCKASSARCRSLMSRATPR